MLELLRRPDRTRCLHIAKLCQNLAHEQIQIGSAVSAKDDGNNGLIFLVSGKQYQAVFCLSGGACLSAQNRDALRGVLIAQQIPVGGSPLLFLWAVRPLRGIRAS